jgi:hypothetical protein
LANVLPWWEKLTAGDPDPEEIAAIEARRIALLQAKADFTIDHLAEVLLRHEEYCAGRTAEEKISSGIRWGLWVGGAPTITPNSADSQKQLEIASGTRSYITAIAPIPARFVFVVAMRRPFVLWLAHFEMLRHQSHER